MGRNTLVLLTFIAVACVAVVGIHLMGQDGPSITDPPDDGPADVPPVETGPSILYNLYDGVLPDDAPSHYIEGQVTELPSPEKDGQVFLGWYSDAGMTDPILAIDAASTGDVEVHALWGDDPLGDVITLSGVIEGSTFISSDTEKVLRITYGQESGGFRPLEVTLTTTVISPIFGQLSQDTTGGTYWAHSLMADAVYVGEYASGDRICTVWDLPSLGSFRLWMHHGYPVLAEVGGTTLGSPSTSEVPVHGISYIGADTTTPGYWPTMYCEGVYIPLPHPDVEGTFLGWFTDEAMTEPLGAVTSSTTGDLVLRAGVDESGLVGKGYTLSIHGMYQVSSSPGFLQPITTTTVIMSGTLETMYLAESDGEFYIHSASDVTYTTTVTNSLGTSTTSERDVDRSGYWTDENESSYSYIYMGNSTVGDRRCELWVSYNDDVDIYFHQYHNTLPMKVEYVYPSYTVTYTLLSEDVDDGSIDRSVHVYSSPGIEVDLPRDISIGEPMTLVAEGDGFTGWYADGVFLSDQHTLEVTRVSPGVHYEARSDAETIVYETMEPDLGSVGLHGDMSDWTIFDRYWNIVTYDSIDTGVYCVVDDCGPVPHIVYFNIAILSATFEWTYEGRQYSVSVDFTESEVLSVSEDDPFDNNRVIYSNQAQVDRYFTVDDACMVQIANQLSAYRSSEGFTDQEFALFVLRMVQAIDYLTDSDTRQAEEYFKYPIEYIADGGGDCEDSSIFYATLMEVLGYEAGIVIFYDHCMAVVAVDDLVYDGTGACQSFVEDGVTYYLCETTATGWHVGETADTDSYSVDDIRYAYMVA